MRFDKGRKSINPSKTVNNQVVLNIDMERNVLAVDELMQQDHCFSCEEVAKDVNFLCIRYHILS